MADSGIQSISCGDILAFTGINLRNNWRKTWTTAQTWIFSSAEVMDWSDQMLAGNRLKLLLDSPGMKDEQSEIKSDNFYNKFAPSRFKSMILQTKASTPELNQLPQEYMKKAWDWFGKHQIGLVPTNLISAAHALHCTGRICLIPNSDWFIETKLFERISSFMAQSPNSDPNGRKKVPWLSSDMMGVFRIEDFVTFILDSSPTKAKNSKKGEEKEEKKSRLSRTDVSCPFYSIPFHCGEPVIVLVDGRLCVGAE